MGVPLAMHSDLQSSLGRAVFPWGHKQGPELWVGLSSGTGRDPWMREGEREKERKEPSDLLQDPAA